jgi:hypothetical protein
VFTVSRWGENSSFQVNAPTNWVSAPLKNSLSQVIFTNSSFAGSNRPLGQVASAWQKGTLPCQFNAICESQTLKILELNYSGVLLFSTHLIRGILSWLGP